MVLRECPTCKIGHIQPSKKRKIVVEFKNPGDVVFEGMAEECDKCGLQFISTEDIETMATFEKEYLEQYKKHH